VTWIALLACTSPCDEGDIRVDKQCVPYEAEEPVQAEVWQPSPGLDWQWQLSGDFEDIDVQAFDADLVEGTWPEGAVRICYFSAGSWEEYREDVADVPEDALGKRLDGWPDERWWDISHPAVRAVVEVRLDRAVESDCDAVEPDNVDGYQNDSGLPLNATEQLAFNRWLADEAHARGLSVGLKNDLDQLDALQPWFDWALNEECVAYDECDAYEDWTKAVLHAEYVDDWSDADALHAEVCEARPEAFSTLVKTWDLGPEYLPCG
jgi:hypothetical protein